MVHSTLNVFFIDFPLDCEMQKNSIFTPLSPEEAAKIKLGDSRKVKEISNIMRFTSEECLKLGIIDRIIDLPLYINSTHFINVHVNHSIFEIWSSMSKKKNYVKEFIEYQNIR